MDSEIKLIVSYTDEVSTQDLKMVQEKLSEIPFSSIIMPENLRRLSNKQIQELIENLQLILAERENR